MTQELIIPSRLGINSDTFSTVSTTQTTKLGDTFWFDGNEYIYVQNTSGTTLVVGAFHYLGDVTDGPFAVKLGVATSTATYGRAVVCVQGAIADDGYGWAIRQGRNFQGLVLASCAANVEVCTSATAGYLDDTLGTNAVIRGVRLLAARSGTDGLASIEANAPMIVTGEALASGVPTFA